MKRFYHMPHFIIGIFLSLWMITPAWAQDKPNILVIWGDDIGQSNISAYTKGVMGYRTPNSGCR
jgi:arylsulfatase